MAKLEGLKDVQAGRYKKGRGGHLPDAVVLHWSAGFGDADAIASYFVAPTKKVNGTTVPRNASYHFAIGRTGEVVQLVDTKDTAWHAGGGITWDGLRDINRRSIGICLANRGPLFKDPRWAAAHPVFTGAHPKPGLGVWGTKFEAFPDEQIEALKGLLARLAVLHPSLRFVCGHEDVVKGKGDPGPALSAHAIDWSEFGLSRLVKDWHTGDWSGGSVEG